MGSGNNLNRAEPVIDYTSLDSAGIIADLIAYAQANYTDTWTDFNEGQIGKVLLDLMGYEGDLVSFYLNALINESFYTVAVRRQNIVTKAKGLDYVVPSAVGATVTLQLTLDAAGSYPFTILASSHKFSNSNGLIYMPVSDVTVPAYSATVDIAAVQGNQITAESLGTSTGAEAQRFRLGQTPLLDGTLVVRVNGTPWTKASYVVDMAPSDEKYTVEVDDDDNVDVIFGDGEFGKIPPISHAIEADYKIGGGRDSNVGSGTISTVVSAPSQVTAVTNPAKSSNGADKPTSKQIRAAIPANIRQNTGAMHETEIADAALQTTGVAKARAEEGNPLIREVKVHIAPNGGGQPTDVLLNQANIDIRAKRMLGLRMTFGGPIYKQISASFIVHAQATSRQGDVQNAVVESFTSPDEDGLWDFDQVSFGGLDSNGDPEISFDVVGDAMNDLNQAGVRRYEIKEMTILPEYRRLSPTSGDGTVSVISLPSNDHERREWVIVFLTPTTFSVYERIIGTVTSLSDATLTDDAQTFLTGLAGLGFTNLVPNRQFEATSFTVGSNSETAITTTAGGLFLATERGAKYYVERLLAASGTVGVAYNALDSAAVNVLDFTVNTGSSPWVAGDKLIIDTYAPVGDVILRDDEIPELMSSNLTVRIAGGIA